MKSSTDMIPLLIPALLLCLSGLPAYAADTMAGTQQRARDEMSAASASFRAYDSNQDGFVSLAEFKAKGKDDLAFKAADIDGDGRLDPGEFIKYVTAKKADHAMPDVTVPSSSMPGPTKSGH
jgi:hypothetical protein